MVACCYQPVNTFGINFLKFLNFSGVNPARVPVFIEKGFTSRCWKLFWDVMTASVE
jgi:hypothetical protein